MHESQVKFEANPASNAAKQDDSIDLGTLVNIIWRGKWIIGLSVLVCAVFAMYYAYMVATPTYRSTSVVVLDTSLSQFTDLSNVVNGLSGDSEEVTTEVQILQSRRLAGKVVDQLDLTRDPEFNVALRDPGFVDRMKANVKNAITTYVPIGAATGGSGFTQEQRQKVTHDRVVTELLSSFSVYNVPNSLVFRITVETNSPVKSATIADTIADLYILDQISVKFEETERAIEWLTERVSQFQQELEQAEGTLASFSSSIQLVSIETLKAQEVRLKELRDRILQTQAEADSVRAMLTELEGVDEPAAQAQILNDSELTAILNSTFGDDAERQTRFDQRLNTVLAQLQTRAIRLDQQIDALEQSEVQMSADLAEQSDDLITLQQYTREAEAVRLLYEYFLGRLKETRAQQGIQQADSRILSQAVIPNAPAAPKKMTLLVMGCFLGAFLGFALTLIREMRTTGLRTPRDLESRFGYTVLGQIPQAHIRKRQQILDYLVEKPASELSEAFRSLRTSVMLTSISSPPQVIISTSCVPGEGKTTNSLGLAHNLIGLGKKVLLIEGDIRRRTLSVYFPDMPKSSGIISAMRPDVELDDAIYKDPASGLHVLGGQPTRVNAADVFSSDEFKNLIAEVRTKYDAIVLDCPPVLVVPDARIVSQVADCTLFTVKWNGTSAVQVEEALRVYHASHQKISGFILSQIDIKRMQAYGQYSQYGAYTNYGSEYYHD